MIGLDIPDYLFGVIDTPDKDYSFRGGSMGKGGKIKYQRR